MAPYGGRDGRFATNPIACADPTSSQPVVADFASSATAEGVVRSIRNRGVAAAPGMLADLLAQP